MHGREIYKLKFGDKINVSNISAGIYILKLITDKGVISEKFIKN